MDELSPFQPPLQIRTSPFVGRTYHSTRVLQEGECILDVSTPYACTIYKQFRTEVCAECWRYDGGRRAFLTSRELGENAGLLFCDDRCMQCWLAREGEEMAVLLTELERTRRRKEKAAGGAGKPAAGDAADQITEEQLSQAWLSAEKGSTRIKTLKQWKSLQLDDFEADLARYVLMALYHYSQEPGRETSSDSAQTPLQAYSNSVRFGASWTDFAELQSGELQQVSKFPELLSDHLRIFRVLKSRFGIHDGSLDSRRKLDEVLTPQNVRTALSVDPGNSFGIWEVPVTEESEGLGFGVYPVPSFFNHHCSPNVRKERDGRRLRFICTRAVAMEEELCISYGHVEGMSLAQRREELQDGWFFRCQCSRCRAEEAVVGGSPEGQRTAP